MGKRTRIPLKVKETFFERISFQIWFSFQSLLERPLKGWLSYRVLQHKEEKERLAERWGETSQNKNIFSHPNRPLLWFHAASVGETASILDLVSTLAVEKDYNILLTTTTIGAKELVYKHLSRNPNLALYHQYAPLDVPAWVERFLENWQPCAAIFVESELWPVRLKLCQKNQILTFLIGARLSPSSLNRWKYFPFLLKIILNCFSWISPKNLENAQRLRLFNQRTPYLLPLDLKYLKAPLFFDPKKSASLKKSLKKKKIFIAASTHQGEEDFFYQAKKLLKNHKDWLFVFAPRHSVRGKKLSKSLGNVPLWSQGEIPQPSDSFWIIDTIGELGLFFSIADCAFVGGSLFPKGKGHNPFEPLQMNLKTSSGPYYENWRETYASLKNEVTIISSVEDFVFWIENVEHNMDRSKITKLNLHKEKLSQMASLIHQTVAQVR